MIELFSHTLIPYIFLFFPGTELNNKLYSYIINEIIFREQNSILLMDPISILKLTRQIFNNKILSSQSSYPYMRHEKISPCYLQFW